MNKVDQMWYLLHICYDFDMVVNPFFRAVHVGWLRALIRVTEIAVCYIHVHVCSVLFGKIINSIGLAVFTKVQL